MTTITIDGKAYELEALPEAARQHLGMIQAVDQEIERLQVLLAITQTARIGYSNALQEALAKA